jgi:hypothetical protein
MVKTPETRQIRCHGVEVDVDEPEQMGLLSAKRPGC